MQMDIYLRQKALYWNPNASEMLQNEWREIENKFRKSRISSELESLNVSPRQRQ